MSAHEDPSSSEVKKSTPDVTTGVAYKWFGYILIFIVILFSVYEIYSTPKDSNEKKEATSSLPKNYSESHMLRNGEIVKVNVPPGYLFTISNGDKTYYLKAQNAEWEKWGDGNDHNTGNHISYFELKCDKEEIEIVCNFTKQ